MARLLAFFSSSREKRVVFFRGSHSLFAIILKHPLFCVNNLNKLKFDIVWTTALSLHEQTTTKTFSIMKTNMHYPEIKTTRFHNLATDYLKNSGKDKY